jgi:hypothetical protein
MINKCDDNIDNNLIIKNKQIFKNLHKKNYINYYKLDFDDLIIIPVTINICLSISKYNFDFIKYSKYIIDTLNDGFSGNINCKYKSSEYSIEYFSNLLSSEINGKIIYDYINCNFDTRIRFYLQSIEYFNKNFEYTFTNSNNINDLINSFYNNGFTIKNENKQNLLINIMKFNCSTLGISNFPWSDYISNNQPMMVFIDYNTIHPEISNTKYTKYNKSRTIIHEVGHILGLKHIFSNTMDSLQSYKIILGKQFFNEIFNFTPEYDTNYLYPDIICEKKPNIIDPILKNNFKFINYIPVNFCCFMDYSPDDVLTHFTKSQILIMRTIINIYKPNLVKNSFKYINKICNSSTILSLSVGKIINFNKNKLSFKSISVNKSFNYKITYTNDNYIISKKAVVNDYK